MGQYRDHHERFDDFLVVAERVRSVGAHKSLKLYYLKKRERRVGLSPMFSFLANADPAATWTIHWTAYPKLVTLGYKDWLFRLKVALFTTPFSSIRGMDTILYSYIRERL